MRRLQANGCEGDPSGATATRRTVLKAIGVGAGLAGFGASTGVAAETQEPWSVIAFPDTQFYARDMTEYPYTMARWIADNHGSENIAFVSHVGDIVENASVEEEWQWMKGAMSEIDDEGIPYSTLPGNHDWAEEGDRSSSIENYKKHFGASIHEGRSYFGGAGPASDEQGRGDLNTYQTFSAGGYDFLHLALEWEPPGTVDDPSTPLGWAQQVLDEHPDRATILTTHSYLRNPPERLDRVTEEGGDGNSGQTVWEELVKQNSQVFMVLCGHWYKPDAEAHQISTNVEGEEVYEVLANYQARENGGHGLLRQIKFQPGEGGSTDAPDRIQMRTYSPVTGVEDDEDSTFGFDLDFDARFGDGSETTPEASFQQGVDGYGGTVDTTLYESDPMTAFGSDETMVVDTREPQDSENAAQALLRFDDIVGSGDGQIPSGSTVDTATLILECVNDGDGATLHRMRTGWNGDDTWNSVGDGIRTDGTDAASGADAETGAIAVGTVAVDVTASVQAWVDGDRNLGWVFHPTGSDGCDLKTAESDEPPRLTVQYTASDGSGGDDGPVTGDADGDGDVDEDDVETIQRSVAGEDVDIDTDAADVDGDGDVDIGDAIGARNISEEGQ